MGLIRKVSIGNDLKNAMHYQVGSNVFSGTISNIILEDGFFNIYVSDDDEISKWKSFNSSAVSHIEYDTKNNG